MLSLHQVSGSDALGWHGAAKYLASSVSTSSVRDGTLACCLCWWCACMLSHDAQKSTSAFSFSFLRGGVQASLSLFPSPYFHLQRGRHAEEWRSSKLHWGRQISPWCFVHRLLCTSTWNVDRELSSQCTSLQSSEEWIAVSVQLQSRLQSSLDQCRTRRSAETKEWLALRCWAGTGSAV